MMLEGLNVLALEDEPIIALELEDLLESIGARVCGSALFFQVSKAPHFLLERGGEAQPLRRRRLAHAMVGNLSCRFQFRYHPADGAAAHLQPPVELAAIHVQPTGIASSNGTHTAATP